MKILRTFMVASAAFFIASSAFAQSTVTDSTTYYYGTTNVGTEYIGDPSATSPTGSFIKGNQGAIAGGTTAIHIIPASGTLATGTITEFVSGTTAGQAFGGDYGRWSMTNQGSGGGYVSGIFGEFGGATATSAMGPWVLQVGVENPPGVFNTIDGFRFQTNGSASNSNQTGAIQFGLGSANPINKVVLISPAIGSPGTRDSHAVLWEGKSNDGTEHAVQWRQFVDVTSNAGASTMLIQKANVGYNSWVTKLALVDDGHVLSGVLVPQTMGQSGAINPMFQNFQTGGAAAFGLIRQTSPGGGGALFVGGSSRSTPSNGSYSALKKDDGLLSLVGVGDKGDNLNAQGGSFQLAADDDWTTTSSPGRACVNTTPAGTTNFLRRVCVDSVGHVTTYGNAPSLSAGCGTGATISGNDLDGEITFGSGSPTGCVMTFVAAYPTRPKCTVTWQANLPVMGYAITTADLTLTQTATSGNKVNYQCKATG